MEYVIIDNAVMNYIILRLIDLTLGVKIKKINKSCVCFGGVVFAIFLPFLYFNKLILLFYRILASIILVMCIRKYNRFKDIAKMYLIFLIYTFMLGGVCFGLINILGFNYTATNLIMNSFEFPMGLFVLILLIIIKLLSKLINFMKNKLRNSNFMYEISLIDNEKVVDSIGFYDSGNCITFDNSGVNIISINLFLKLYNEIDIIDVVVKKKNICNLKDVSYIEISGIGNGEKYLSFVIDKMIVNGCNYLRPRIAVAMKNFDNYECILHKEFVGGN